MDEFRRGSWVHLAAFVGCVVVMAGFAARGWWLRGRGLVEGELWLRRVWAVAMLVTQGAVLALSFTPERFDPRHSFPFHLCDVTVLVAAAGLWRGTRVLRTLTYFWALGLSTQAFVTPVLVEGPATLAFWLFWLTHVQVVGSAVYEVVALGYRPEARDWVLAAGATLVYGVLALAVDLVLGANYGFVGPNDASTAGTAVELMGPWPARLVVLYASVAGWLALLWLVWPAGRAVGRALRSARSRG